MSNISSVIAIAKKAGDAILAIYHADDFDVQYKSDHSPVTEADLMANQIIISELNLISDFPVLTEESQVGFQKRKNWQKYWLVDPLDGTDFTVNIALIEGQQPILGVVYIPVTGDMYFAEKGLGAFKNDQSIYNHSTRKNLIAANSVFHSSDRVVNFFKEHRITQIIEFGSSLKICKLAEGVIDVYPRLNGTKEWDTAASHIIANEAGCKLIDVKTLKPLLYNKLSFKNNTFIIAYST